LEVHFGTHSISAHAAMFASRSPLFYSLLVEERPVPTSAEDFISYTQGNIYFSNVNYAALKRVVDYVNTGKKFKHSRRDDNYDDFVKLYKLLRLSDLPSLLKLPGIFKDVRIELEDGSLDCHSIILASRCPFFKPLLRSQSNWFLETNDGLPTVDMKASKGFDSYN
jgi:BTB/POZ domain